MQFEITSKGKTVQASLSQVKTLIRTIKSQPNCISVERIHRKNAVSDWGRSFRNRWVFKRQSSTPQDGTFYTLLEVYIKGVSK